MTSLGRTGNLPPAGGLARPHFDMKTIPSSAPTIRPTPSDLPRVPESGARAIGFAALVVGMGFLAGCGPSAPPVESSPRPDPPPAAESGRGTSTAPEASKLVGRWLRPDGGYVLEIRGVDAGSGKLEATYLNPQPIHVARAEARTEAGRLTVFVELQDVNYPGSTYRLTYFPPKDLLFGTYYQAKLGESFEVEFVRSP